MAVEEGIIYYVGLVGQAGAGKETAYKAAATVVPSVKVRFSFFLEVDNYDRGLPDLRGRTQYWNTHDRMRIEKKKPHILAELAIAYGRQEVINFRLAGSKAPFYLVVFDGMRRIEDYHHLLHNVPNIGFIAVEASSATRQVRQANRPRQLEGDEDPKLFRMMEEREATEVDMMMKDILQRGKDDKRFVGITNNGEIDPFQAEVQNYLFSGLGVPRLQPATS